MTQIFREEGAVWDELGLELDRWHRAGRTAHFWLRDDDAVEPTSALDRLLAIGEEAKAPLTLAVIPATTGAPLADRLAGSDLVNVAVHGWSHETHAAPGRKKQELGPERPLATVLGQLEAGYAKLAGLHAQRFVPVLVPPWNRIDPAICARLPELGFRALSVFGPAGDAGDIARVNTHVDLIDWHGTRGCRPHGVLAAEIVAQLKSRFDGSDEPIGILTHHLVHDEAAWAFLEALFSRTAGKPAAVWKGLPELL